MVAWLGAIVVVHLIIGPQVAARGIPRMYLRLAGHGSYSGFGTVLTLGRLNGWNGLVDTRWGTILMIKTGLFLAMVLSATFETLWLSPRLRRLGQPVNGALANERMLAQGGGQEGRPVYVGHGDSVYDLSSSPAWEKGLHQGRHRAGQDLTQALREAPHGAEMLACFPALKPPGESQRYRRLLRVHLVLARAVVALRFGALLASAVWS